MRCVLLFILTIIFSLDALKGQVQWKLRLDRDQIRVYEGQTDNSKIKSIKVETTVDARLSQIAAVFLDINTQDEWSPNTKSSLLFRISPSELYYYSEVGLPWPFSPRDYVAHIKVNQDPDSKILTMDVWNASDFVAKKQKIVRVTNSFAKWVVKPVGNNQNNIEFTMFVDPAGAIPSWLVNMFLTSGPFESFKKLRTHLQKPDYAYVHLPFVND